MLGKKNHIILFLFFFLVLWGLFSLISWKKSNFLRVHYIQTETKNLKAGVELFKASQLNKGKLSQLNDLCNKFHKNLSIDIVVFNKDLTPLNETNQTLFNPVYAEVKHKIKSKILRLHASSSQDMLLNKDTALKSGSLYAVFPIKNQDGQELTGLALKQINPDFAEINYFAQALLAVVIAILLSGFTFWIIEKSIRKPLEDIEIEALKIADGQSDSIMTDTQADWSRDLARILNISFEKYIKQLNDAKNNKQEMDSVFLSMQHGALALSMDGTIMTANKAALELLNIKRSPIGKSIQESTRNSGLQTFAEKLLKQKEPLESEFTLYDYDNEERFIQANGSALRDSNSKTIGMLIILSDITRVKRLESMRKDFVANVSHEIKTPITAIRGSVETLLEGAMDSPEESRKFMKIITRHSDRLIALVDDLLSLSAVEKNSMGKDYDFSPYDIKNLAGNVIDLCQAKAEEKNIELSSECPAGITAKIAAQQMEQALLNLVDNAIKYTNDNGKVTINAQQKDNNVEISVKDTGSGIAKEHIPRLFERFYRVDKARSRKLGGTGLGLAIVKHIVQTHNGKIIVESQLGEGSKFIISIPLETAKEA
jgi:two-component system phosphate regulon sensor histidine kinase PhoR